MPKHEASISPPPLKKIKCDHTPLSENAIHLDNERVSPQCVPSPVQLTTVSDLPASSNVDTVSLKDILGDPLIKEAWLFNYLIDVDFVMSHFDEDIRDLINVRFVHGSWKAEDGNRVAIQEAASRWENSRVIVAHMPEAYGTHHSKMMVLFRHDELVQLIILTANFIPQDFQMCQAVWKSPLLPYLSHRDDSQIPYQDTKIGSGARFKQDFLDYLAHYGHNKLNDLIVKLQELDFSPIRAALVSSVPTSQSLENQSQQKTMFGWPGLRRTLGSVPIDSASSSTPQIVTQISSVASVGEKWLSQTLFPVLSTPGNSLKKATQYIVFPTADTIRRSTQGYVAGASIHMKTQKPAQRKQLDFLRPMLRHWASDHQAGHAIREAGRKRAAPHIKTYVRFRDESMEEIDWAMMASANLSTQAWGAAGNLQKGSVRICSYEIGVLLWPDLFKEHDDEQVTMVPTFKNDTPDEGNMTANFADGKEATAPTSSKPRRLVGWRMPYDLPLSKYKMDEMPWSNAIAHDEPDWMGRSWPGFGHNGR